MQEIAKNRQRFDSLPPAQQAGILCNGARFQKFAAARCSLQGNQFSTSAAAQYLRNFCQIDSRRQLSSDKLALSKFHILCTEFDAWLGKIATPL